MKHGEAEQAYGEYLAERAAENNLTVREYLEALTHMNAPKLHTLEVAELIRGYAENADLNSDLASEGFLDINGD